MSALNGSNILMQDFTVESPIGFWHVAMTQKGLAELTPLGSPADTACKEKKPETSLQRDVATLLERYFHRQPVDFADLPIDWEAHEKAGGFRIRIWQTLARIPYGRTVTYAQLGQMAGFPNTARAVGQALGHNPLPIIVPCHRVIAKGGKCGLLGGFMRGKAGGLSLKRYLLATEGIYIPHG
jgi:methylated-DNA-[protein]-cysteine S-methyltransferase